MIPSRMTFSLDRTTWRPIVHPPLIQHQLSDWEIQNVGWMIPETASSSAMDSDRGSMTKNRSSIKDYGELESYQQKK
jgi:hypothetical protein